MYHSNHQPCWHTGKTFSESLYSRFGSVVLPVWQYAIQRDETWNVKRYRCHNKPSKSVQQHSKVQYSIYHTSRQHKSKRKSHPKQLVRNQVQLWYKSVNISKHCGCRSNHKRSAKIKYVWVRIPCLVVVTGYEPQQRKKTDKNE